MAIYLQLFSYSGWNNLNYLVGELKHPQKNLPLSILISIPVIIIVYLFTNIAYFAVLPLEIIKSDRPIGSEFGLVTMGFPGIILVSVMVICSVFGAVNANIYSNCRLMAESAIDGIIFPNFFTKTKNNSPFYSLLLTCFVSCLFTIPGQLEILFGISSFITCIYTLLAVVALLVLRKKYPDLHRPFKVFTPIPYIFIIISIGLTIIPIVCAKKVEAALPYLLSVFVTIIPIPWIYFKLKPKQKDVN